MIGYIQLADITKGEYAWQLPHRKGQQINKELSAFDKW